MKERLKKHVENLFEAAPKTRAALELQEELTANCIEKYDDLVSQGLSEEDAYQNVVGGIGNVSDLLRGLTNETYVLNREPDMALKRKTALITSISVGIYIIDLMFFLGMTVLCGEPIVGLLGAIAIAVIPTCMLVYQAIAYPRYTMEEDTVVESFKAWNHGNSHDKAIRQALSSVIWMLCLIIYFLVSFSTGKWYITWVIFLIATCLECILKLVFSLRVHDR